MRTRPSVEGPLHRPAIGGLFAEPDIRTAPPVAPGSDSSREAASLVTNPIRARSYRLIFAALVEAGFPLNREELSERTGIKESSLCARISELRPTWLAVAGSRVLSSSGVACDAYMLTEAGHRRWHDANRPLSVSQGTPPEEA